MPMPERLATTFAEQCHKWADAADSSLDEPFDSDYIEDFLTNYRTEVNLPHLIVLDMQLGAFDHGAGNGLLIWHHGDPLVWLYEGEAVTIPIDDNFKLVS